ncbi:MAG: hypothetical protein L6R40_002691 [Gallowayella cf. fulva]|nr:MAG: hypothetical protein L6R40_002691 [Xanthomendoza cf. fulva]
MARNQKKKSTNRLGKKVSDQPVASHSSRTRPPQLPDQSGDDELSLDHSIPHDGLELNPRPSKRQKTAAASAALSASVTESSSSQHSANLVSNTLTDSDPSLPSEVQHLLVQYDFSIMSIISSSKIHQKVGTLVTRMENFTLANINAKPGVVILGAKAASASKMISVVEIAKADIAKRGGKWYQYSKLQSELLPFKERQKKQPRSGRTLAEGASERSGMATASEGPQDAELDAETGLMDTRADDSDDGEAAFETLQLQPGVAAADIRNKVRATPIMTIYLSCVPVPGLKDLFG